ncbi:hypothetical protein LRS05_15545 [Flavobacterium sp. J372]|uniref:hypothetical protein n=1 Tax=Flavobacterium sp. J372 TaxID=2898436 RepID=UPI00215126D5|nr:hypothetical protein [Flavobacterium sp. J372]MCR5863442.1 hypothetical protein [Flavobacterium sp. J372]
MDVIFDSNVFDNLISGELEIDIIKNKDHKIIVTHIQIDELNECKDTEKRAQLFNRVVELKPEKISTETFVIGVSRIGSAKIGGSKIYDSIMRGNPKHINDALIGETAVKNNLMLITNDIKLKKKILELGGKCMSVQEFKNL